MSQGVMSQALVSFLHIEPHRELLSSWGLTLGLGSPSPHCTVLKKPSLLSARALCGVQP